MRVLRNEWRMGKPIIVQSIIAICAAVWVVEIVLRLLNPQHFQSFVQFGSFWPWSVFATPWTWLTSMFLHAPNVTHVLFNMLALWSIGPVLERLMGHWQFLALYLISGFGGSVAQVISSRVTGNWSVSSYGASGAIFGLFAAVLVTHRIIGAELRSILILMAVNFAIPLLVPNIAWQAHVGGFIIGGVLTWLLIYGITPLRKWSLTKRMWLYGSCVVIILLVVLVLCAPSPALVSAVNSFAL
jgi:membrane associated rhomboid family serine protease